MLKATLLLMIEPNQSAYVKDRLLLDNVLLATELIKDCHKNSISSLCVIKFDISEAFDTVQWDFITATLRAMRIPQNLIHWIYLCMSRKTLSVCVNHGLEGFFRSERGLHQGCSFALCYL